MKNALRTGALASMILLSPAPGAHAGLGDCGQPVTSGSSPTASDALFVLRAAVGAAACGLVVCDVDATCTIAASDALRLLRKVVGQPIELDCSCGLMTTTSSTSTMPTTTTTFVEPTTTTTTLAPATWTQVFAIIDASTCGDGGCHGFGFEEGDLGGMHDIDLAYDSLVNVPSSQVPTLDRIEPGDPSLSYAIHKIEGTFASVGGDPDGERMPNEGDPLTDEEKAIWRSWVLSGAPKN